MCDLSLGTCQIPSGGPGDAQVNDMGALLQKVLVMDQVVEPDTADTANADIAARPDHLPDMEADGHVNGKKVVDASGVGI